MNTVNMAFVNLPANWEGAVDGEKAKNIKAHTPYGLPLGILWLSSYIKKHSKRIDGVSLIDYQTEMANSDAYSGIDDYLLKCAEKSLDFEPDIIGISVMFSSTHHLFVKTAQVLKERWPNACIITGGIHATNFAKEILEQPAVDYVIRGEAEQALTDFIDSFGDDEEMIKIRGVYNKEKLQREDCPIITEYIQNLDAVPFPDWSIAKMDSYSQEASRMRRVEFEDEVTIEKRSAIMMTSRGCPFRCTFCASHTVHGRVMRYRSPENVISEMRALNEQYGVNVFVFEDDMFICSRKQAKALLNAIIAYKKTVPGFEIHFPNALNVEVMTDEILDLLVEAGMKITIMAIESGSPYVQKEIIKKNVKLDKAAHVVSYLRGKGVIVRTGFIIGFPRETIEMIQETIDYCINLKADWCNINIAQPLIGTEMYRDFDEMGVLPDGDQLWSHNFEDATDFQAKQAMNERVFETEEISSRDLIKLQYRANLMINFVNNVNLREKKYDVAEKLFQGIVDSYGFHIIALDSLRKAKERLGKKTEAEELNSRIIDLIRSDQKARRMFEEHNDLLPDFDHMLEEVAPDLVA